VSACRSFAAAASSAALSNTAKVNEYFKSTSVGSQVAQVFGRVISECGSTSSGVSRTYCSDVYGACSSNVLAYTLPSGSYIVNCPLYFSAIPATTNTCHAQDQATTTLHEVTHLTQIKGTQDLGYGYSAATRLSSSQALNNADSYALFANGEYPPPT
jgi:deuterolysin